MGLRGRGALAIWHDLDPAAEADFVEWHNREHIPERVGVPGFLRGRRFRAVAEGASPRWFVLYETEGPDVLQSPAYLARLNDPTPWTRRLTPAFGNVARAACAVEATRGAGVGGHAMTVRLDAVEPGREAELRRWLTAECLPAVHAAPGVVGAHLCVADEGASTSANETAEKRGRAERDRVPGWTVVVEAGSDDDALAAVRGRFGDAAWAERAGGVAEVGVYQLDYLLARE